MKIAMTYISLIALAMGTAKVTTMAVDKFFDTLEAAEKQQAKQQEMFSEKKASKAKPEKKEMFSERKGPFDTGSGTPITVC